MDDYITVEGQNDSNISVEGRLDRTEGKSQSTSDSNTEQGSLTGNTVTLKPSNSHLPQTNSHEMLLLPFVGLIICATIIIGYGISIITRKKRSDSVSFQ